jgi:acyl-CoA synthetase (NDP forming)/RimJ/RimL family protein N-acetyltransferase
MERHGVDALLTHGGLVHLRPVNESDREALLRLHARASDDSIYYRFFTASRHAADVYLERLLRAAGTEEQALVALVGRDIVGVAGFEPVSATTAEFAVLVDDTEQHEGVGTLLIEHLASMARHRGIQRFVADVLADNTAALRMIRRLGFEVSADLEYGTAQLSFDLEPRSPVVAAIDDRDRIADAASLRRLLAPQSVAVIGASVRPRAVGHEVLRHILDGGFTGGVYAVNPKHDSVLGVPCVASPRELPAAPDLALVAVPALSVPAVVDACGKRGVRGVVLLTAGFGETGPAGQALQREVLAIARSHGMRMIGPNCLGVLNSDPAVRLNATFAALPMRPGRLGLVSQSGALGIAVLAAAQGRGLGVAQFVSVGNKADVSGNDLLLAWERDDHVGVIGLYLESFGNPRKFARIARRVAHTKPIIAIKAGRSLAGQRAGRSHTAAAAASDAVVDALFTQAGVLRVDSMEQLVDVSRLLLDQPLPAGPRVAIVGNSGGPEILAADAAEAAGLSVVELAAATVDRLRGAAPAAASCENPVDLTAGAQPELFADAVRVLLDAPEVDVVLGVFTETAVADPAEIVSRVATIAAGSGKPTVVTQVGSEPGAVQGTPVFAFPEPAAAALGYAYRYARIRSASVSEPLRPATVDPDGARSLVRQALAAGGEWLAPDDVDALLARYDIPVCPYRVVSTPDAAVQAAAELGYPLAAKIARGTVHKTEAGGVRLNLRDPAAVRDAVAAIQATGATDVLLQPMVGSGVELIIGAVQDQQFGPVVMIGAGGVLADMIADRQLRLAPLTDDDADGMIDGLRTAPLLDGYRGGPVVSRLAVRRLLVRLATLAGDLPEVAELDLNPVICRGGDDLIVVDAKVRIAAAATLPDPVLRQLRG